MKNIKNDLIDAVEVTFNAANAEPNEKVFYFTSPEEFNNETTIKIVNGNIVYSKTEKTPRKRLTYAGIVRNCKNGMYIRIGIATCKHGENFVKSIGREAALENALKQNTVYDMGAGKICQNKDTFLMNRHVVHVHPDSKPYYAFMRFVRKFEKNRDFFKSNM